MPVSGAPVSTTPVTSAYPGSPGGIIWVGAGPFFHNGHAALCWKPPGGGVHPESIFGFIPSHFRQDGLIVTGHMMPNTDVEPGNELNFHVEVITKIMELKKAMGADTPVVFVGFSQGGIELSATARHLANQTGGRWDHQVLVLVSAPYGAAYLHQPMRSMVQGSLHFNPHLGIGLSRHFGRRLAAGEIAQLRRAWTGSPSDLDALVNLIEHSAVDSGDALQNAQIIGMQRGGFGPAIDTGGHVIALNLYGDTVVKVDDNLRATLRSYPDMRNIMVAGTEHGLVFLDAAVYRAALALPTPANSIRGHYAHQWGLAT